MIKFRRVLKNGCKAWSYGPCFEVDPKQVLEVLPMYHVYDRSRPSQEYCVLHLIGGEKVEVFASEREVDADLNGI